ncbi:MAG: hypothetical protein WD894_10465 [Pirellulales bacterium]
MYSQLIAAPDPIPFNKPRFIRWPSVCDTSRTNWVNPSAEPQPPDPAPGAETSTIDVGCHLHMPSLQPGEPLPQYLQNIETLCMPVATATQQTACAAYTFSADAAQSWNPTLDIGPWTLDVAPWTSGLGPGTWDLGLSSDKPASSNQHAKTPKKTGRPPLFDHVRRAQVCAMVRTGCSLRNAAQNAGVNMASIYYACRTDDTFAEQLRAAEQHRDLGGVRRINNAGEKSWRAAAWILERASPKHFSLRGTKKASTPKHLRKRHLKRFVKSIALEVLVEWMQSTQRAPIVSPGLEAIEGRLAQLEDQRQRLLDTADDGEELHGHLEDDQDFDVDDQDDQPGERGGVSPPMTDEDDEELTDDDSSDDNDLDDDEFEDELEDEADEDGSEEEDEPEDEDDEDGAVNDEAAANCSYQEFLRLYRRRRQ